MDTVINCTRDATRLQGQGPAPGCAVRPTVSAESWAQIGHERRHRGWYPCSPNHVPTASGLHGRCRRRSVIASRVWPFAD